VNDEHRDVIEARIFYARPLGVEVASWLTSLLGGIAVYSIYLALVPYPRGTFPISKPGAILLCCLAVLLAGIGLQLWLLSGRLTAWLGAMTWALLHASVEGVMLVSRIRGGFSIREAVDLTPHRAASIVLSLTLIALLCLRGTRSWFAWAHRLRSATTPDLAAAPGADSGSVRAARDFRHACR
jgi:hypothetical protein